MMMSLFRQARIGLSALCVWGLLAAQTPAALALNGPMLGAVEISAVKIWLQTNAAAEVQLHYWPAATPQARRRLRGQTQAAQDYALSFNLENLQPGTRYHYQIQEAGQPASKTYTFRTQPWRKGMDLPNLTIALGSCVYINDPMVDPPGQEIGGDYAIFEQIARTQPDLMLWLGDNVYLRPPDFYSKAAIARRYRQLRSLPEIQTLLHSTAHYAIWDDHDYGDNDSNRAYRLRSESLEAFENAWANPAYGLPEAPGVFTRFQWADAEFFLTDNRYYRAPNALPEPDKDYFGPQQWRWLKDALVSSTATFKLIAIGNQVLNTQSPSENMYSYERAYREFLDWLTESRIPGVVLLTGDRHHSEFFKLPRPGTYPLHEWTVSPLTSKAYPPFPVETEVPIRLPGSLLKERNFGLLQISGPRGQRELHLRLHDARGQLRWEYRIPEQALQLPAP
ncbi:MAG: alkaline phosphatase D family protein [Candidatus Sericytochromatia bacterium]|nr:alkaline phosphatase D family protein [Candidatus Sericytochromatia bacterium]